MFWRVIFARAFMVAFICAIGFAVIAVLIGENNIDWFDSAGISMIRGMESPGLTGVMKFFTFIGAGHPVSIITVFIGCALYFPLKYRWELVFFVGVVSGSALLNVVLKLLFHRARPTLNRIVEANGFSYPSGHSMAAFTLYGVLCYLLWKNIKNVIGRVALIAAASIIILTIGISRIYLGVHYPSDVIGGYLASCAWLAACIGFFENFRKNLPFSGHLVLQQRRFDGYSFMKYIFERNEVTEIAILLAEGVSYERQLSFDPYLHHYDHRSSRNVHGRLLTRK
ncbi:phosphatase PAP2 family protein [Cohnella kolymensis]|uniref:phosphatase PAP2 family protein n=1 Tax=Cohnella kolymensis TaxID=1590652 RepID=UPI000B19F738|nr:phosphatase PAP2 family protein [Cohnella kolymensis]